MLSICIRFFTVYSKAAMKRIHILMMPYLFLLAKKKTAAAI